MLQDFEMYLSRRSAPTTVRLRVFWITKLSAHCDLATATESDLYEFLYSDDWKPATRATILASMRSYYRWVALNGGTNVALGLERVKVPRTRSRIASDETILAGISNGTPTEQAMLRLGAECGLRVTEIATLRTSDRDGEWLTVTGKGGYTRSVHVEPELLALLHALERTTARWGYYFPAARNRGPVASSTVWRHIRKLTGLNTHSLRHRAGTSVYRGTGYDLRLAQEFLGHSSPTTTAIYVHIEREQLMTASAASRLHAA